MYAALFLKYLKPIANNKMLSQIQDRDVALQNAHDRLEARVQEVHPGIRGNGLDPRFGLRTAGPAESQCPQRPETLRRIPVTLILAISPVFPLHFRSAFRTLPS